MKYREGYIYSSDPYQDLFCGGRMNPHEFLVNKDDADKVEEAMEIIEAYLSGLIDKEILEVG